MDTNERINTVLDYIENNLTEDLSLTKLSNIASMSKFHFQRIFQSIVGDPLSTYIRNRRLTEASYKIRNSDDKIIDIAFNYGFNSHEAFNHSFKKYFLCSPKDLKQSKLRIPNYCKPDIISKYISKPSKIKLDSFSLAGINSQLDIKDFSVSKEVIKLGKKVISLTPITDQSDKLYSVIDLTESSCNYFTGFKTDKRANNGLINIDINETEYLLFIYTGVIRRILDAHRYIKNSIVPIYTDKKINRYIEIYPTSYNIENRVEILIPI